MFVLAGSTIIPTLGSVVPVKGGVLGVCKSDPSF